MSTDTEADARKLLHGWDTAAGEIVVPLDATLDQCEQIAKTHGLTLYRPGEYHGQPCVVVTDDCRAYALVDGQPKVIAG